MKNQRIRLIYCIRFTSCFLFICFFISALAQVKTTLKNRYLKDSLTKIFESYNNINGLQIVFRNDTAESIYIEGKTENHVLKGSKYRTYYSLKYGGDLFFLKERFPLIEKFVQNKDLRNSIKKNEKNFVLTIEPQSMSIKPYSDEGSIFCDFRYSSLLKFVQRLNSHYNDTIVPAGDSILIIQAIVNRDGSLGEKMLLHGSQKDKLYTYLFDHYEDYIRTDQVSKKHEELFLPYRSGGVPYTSIIEIFVRLNPNKAFTVNGNGRERKLQIESYKEDPNDPLQIF